MTDQNSRKYKTIVSWRQEKLVCLTRPTLCSYVILTDIRLLFHKKEVCDKFFLGGSTDGNLNAYVIEPLVTKIQKYLPSRLTQQTTIEGGGLGSGLCITCIPGQYQIVFTRSKEASSLSHFKRLCITRTNNKYIQNALALHLFLPYFGSL